MRNHVAAHGVSRGSIGAEMGQMWENDAEHETAPTGELVPHQPGPDRDSTPSRGRGNRG